MVGFIQNFTMLDKSELGQSFIAVRQRLVSSWSVVGQQLVRGWSAVSQQLVRVWSPVVQRLVIGKSMAREIGRAHV